MGEKIIQIDYENPKNLSTYFESHPAYSSDFMAFQHMELWLKGLSLKEGLFVPTNSRIPLVISCRIAGNRQKLGPVPFYLGNITYNISDFNTLERISSGQTFVNKWLPVLFKSWTRQNYGFQKKLSLSMEDSTPYENLFEVSFSDFKRGVYGHLELKSELGYAEVLTSGGEEFIREFRSKRLFELYKERSFFGYNGQAIDFSDLDSFAFVDEAVGFSHRKKNWDWMIFKSEDLADDVRLILRKKCKRAGYGKENEVATFFMNGKIYRINGEVDFDYDVDDLTKPWKAYISDGKDNQVEIKTDFIAPFVEKSSINRKIGSIKVSLDLQRVIAETSVTGIINGERINVRGISSLESNKGIERGTKYFKD